MSSLIRANVDCLPWWHARFAPYTDGRQYVIASGCGTSGGNVTCGPDAMRASAEQVLRAWGQWSIWRSLPLTVYTLARYIASEVGSGTPEERVAVGMASINRVRLEGLRDVNALLLYRQGAGNPHRGYYGPIHGDGSSAPYGRWASTARDPTVGDVLIADFLLRDGDQGWARGADDQADVTNTAFYTNPPATVRSFGAKRSYWVGPLPGVDHRVTYLFTKRPDIAPDSPEGQYLIERGVAATGAPSPDWSGLGVCIRRGWVVAAAVGTASVLLSLALSAPWPRLPALSGASRHDRSAPP